MKLLAAAASLIAAAEGASIGSGLQSVLQQVIGPDAQKSKPNILFVITDDQDLELDSVAYTPLIQKHLRDKGTFFRNHFVTTSLCCPSRVSLWTGRQAHNTNVTDVHPPYGKYGRK
jgi:arylsulfatase A-like enzyme